MKWMCQEFNRKQLVHITQHSSKQKVQRWDYPPYVGGVTSS